MKIYIIFVLVIGFLGFLMQAYRGFFLTPEFYVEALETVGIQESAKQAIRDSRNGAIFSAILIIFGIAVLLF